MKPVHDYRPDIDGLRAVAVLSVLAFHYGATWLPGGFAGVDVFFVISGYLITKQLAENVERNGRLSGLLIDFYVRRIRRIFPALLAMLAGTLTVGWLLLIPGDYVIAGSSSAYAAVGAGNFYFYWNTGYFDRGADLQLFLHTWSLGVEEQFYLVWPVVLFMLLHFAQRRVIQILIVAAMVAIGLAYSAATVPTNPKAAFFLPLPRAWELCAGALMAFLPSISSKWLSQIAGAAGIALIAVAFFYLDGSETALGLSMVPAALGAALVIAPKQPSMVARWLAASPIRSVGLISYSLYLWHWPIVTFYRLTHLEQLPRPLEAIVLIGLTFAISYLSYRFIERPIRSWSWKWAITMVPASLVVATAGAAIHRNEGIPGRLVPEAIALYASANDYSKRRPQCHRNDDFDPPLTESCVFGTARSPVAAMWSDSHGVEIAENLGAIGATKGYGVVALTYSSCPPALNYISPIQPKCAAFNGRAIDYLLNNSQIQTVILTAYYEYYLGKPDKIAFEHSFEAAVARLAEGGKRVVLVASAPRTGYSLPQAAARMAMLNRTAAIDLPLAKHRETTGEARALLNRLAAQYSNVAIVDPADTLCRGETCQLISGGKPVLFDDHHLTLTAAKAVAERIPLDPATVASKEK